MKKIAKFFLLILVAATLLLLSGVSYAQNQSFAGGIESGYLYVDGENGWLTGIAPGTDLNQINKLLVPGDLTAEGEYIGTGTALFSSAANQTLTAVVTGDVNGDGEITITDLLMVKSHILGTELMGSAAVAGDLNGDSDVSIADFLDVKSNLLGISEITFNRRPGTDSALILAPGASQQWLIGGAKYVSDRPELVYVDGNGLLTAGNM